MIKNRLKKSINRLKGWTKQGRIEAYRLYDRDIPEIPYIIDIYQNHAVVFEKGKSLSQEDEKPEKNRLEISQALSELLQIPSQNIHFKLRQKQKGKEQYEKITPKSQFLQVKEGDLLFEVNLSKYLDTGLFLDHRPWRTALAKQKQKLKVLNLFSYTCSLSVAIAFKGSLTTNVDLSKTYLDWGKRNFQINKLPQEEHQFIQADIMNFLIDHNEKYDLILLDPPSFSNSKSMDQDFNIQDQHLFLLTECHRLLNTSGELWFSNNFRKFQMDPICQDIFDIKNTTEQTTPYDFAKKTPHHSYELRPK